MRHVRDTVGLADPGDVDAAAASARAAQRTWAAATYADRAGVLRSAAAALSSRSAELRELIMRETGCVGGKADYEIGAAASELIEAAALASRSPGELVPTTHPGRLSICERVPVGLVGVITPWNFPLVLGMRVIAPALALKIFIPNGPLLRLRPHPRRVSSGRSRLRLDRRCLHSAIYRHCVLLRSLVLILKRFCVLNGALYDADTTR